MGLVGIAMEAQGVDMRVGVLDLADPLAGEIGGQPFLPELVFTFDFTLGLRSWSIKETNIIKAQR